MEDQFPKEGPNEMLLCQVSQTNFLEAMFCE